MTPESLLSERGIAAGDWVTALRADHDNAMVLAFETPVDPAPASTKLEGPLEIVWVESLGYWQFNIAGRSIDPSTIEAAVPQ